MILIYKVFFPSISTFETPPTPVWYMGSSRCGMRQNALAALTDGGAYHSAMAAGGHERS